MRDLDHNLHLDQEWKDYELYEKVRLRERLRRAIFLSLTFFIFLGLCSYPIVKDRYPKWKSEGVARQVWVELESAKVDAIRDQAGRRLVVLPEGQLQIYKKSKCTDSQETLIRTLDLDSEIRVLPKDFADKAKIGSAVESICYDVFTGIQNYSEIPKVFIFLSVKKMANSLEEWSPAELTSASYLSIQGESGQVQLD